MFTSRDVIGDEGVIDAATAVWRKPVTVNRENDLPSSLSGKKFNKHLFE